MLRIVSLRFLLISAACWKLAQKRSGRLPRKCAVIRLDYKLGGTIPDMAGNWLKFEKDTLDKPEVFEMAGILNIDADGIVGKLLRVWGWFDAQTRDGNAPVTVILLLDRITGVSGFCKAMHKVGWLQIGEETITLPHFDRHNGATAKERAGTNRRVSNHRQRNAQHVPNVTPEALQKALPEKRREDELPLSSPNDEKPSVLPKGWKSMNKEQSKRTRVESNSPMMIQIGQFFGRKPETRWTVAEAVALDELRPPAEEVDLLSRYYSLPLDHDDDFRRRNLPTLLNNWNGELDKARCHFATTSAA